MEIKFKRDTSFRKQFFVPDSFAHPAKMDAQLLIWIVEKYTKVGEVVLDPMAGMGTMMLACILGRDVVLVELEGKFCKMMRDNWEEVRMRPQLGYQIGQCEIIQGDARQLEGLVDKIVTSPPYAENTHHSDDALDLQDFTPGRTGRVGGTAGNSEGQIGQLPYGQIDKIVTSPPYAAAQSGGGIAQEGYTKSYQKDKIRGGNLDPVGKRSYMPENTGDNPDNIDALPYGNIDSIITSPPYEGIESRDRSQDNSYIEDRERVHAGGSINIGKGYQASPDNIGNLKNQSYLEAMLRVYQQCYKVLKPQGLMILVTKNFIRNKQVVRLDEDTIKLCEQAGFSFVEKHYRELPSQSFWRVIYHQKHPGVEQILHEDVLVLKKS